MTWDYRVIEYKKQANADVKWHMERMINYGLGEERLKRGLLKQHLKDLKVPEERRVFLELLLWNKKF